MLRYPKRPSGSQTDPTGVIAPWRVALLMPETIASEPTYEELQAAPSNVDAVYEILDGRIVEKPSMGVYAVLVARVILMKLHPYLTTANSEVVVPRVSIRV